MRKSQPRQRVAEWGRTTIPKALGVKQREMEDWEGIRSEKLLRHQMI